MARRSQRTAIAESARRTLAPFAALCALAGASASASARLERTVAFQERPAELSPRTPGASEPTLERDAARLALERGLAWLAARQAGEPGGALPAANAKDYAPVAVTALAALAWMAGGTSPGRGPHGRELSAAIDYLVSRTDLEQGSERHGYVSVDGDSWSKMHGHGFATLALAQAYAISPRTARGGAIERALSAAVRRIEASQGVEGGWYYQPVRVAEHEGSVTICLVQALRAAHDAGLSVDVEVIEHAVDYVKRLQNENGSFRYGLGVEGSTVALTAAAISTLNATGTYGGREVDAGYDFLFRELSAREGDLRGRRAAAGEETFPHYERLYLAQAFWQHSDTAVFERWIREERRRLLADQKDDGRWSDPRFGDCYATAMTCLVLALPEGLLPIFQR